MIINKGPFLLKLPYCLKASDGKFHTLEDIVQENGAQHAIEHLNKDEITRGDIRAIEIAFQYWTAEYYAPLTLHTNFSRFCLPMKRPLSKDEKWQITNGDFRCILTSGHIPSAEGMEPVGLPFGTKARLILIYINTQAYKSRTGTIEMGESLSQFMKSLGIHVSGGKNGSIRYVKEQAARLARCRFEFSNPGKWYETEQLTDLTFSRSQLWQVSDKNERWPSQITISQDFKKSLDSHSYVLCAVAISLLRNSPLALDWYMFLAQRLQVTLKPTFIGWKGLYRQFGSRMERIADFRKESINALKRVSAVFPTAHLHVYQKGIELLPSMPVSRLVDQNRGGKTQIKGN